ncbi:phosphoserine phosphatase [Actinobacillus ureae]|uniref:phosphoserine phosphatase SerB n=1 Tax=Actinobacillus ureae TaxID=723 RepID=UPI000E18496D|nr:phosphoserine phosphatase SerB [Actinobacillus ureae]SUT85507.1 phosphoserine phosphatase [Actinobacillus ureae]SUU42886.1 phosphoserine phosphatase [Actinobacillus ureae]
MPNTIFIFAKQLNEQHIQQFSAQTGAVCVKQAVYLGYSLAFFETNVAACDLREAASQIAADVADLAIVPNLAEAGLLVMDMDSTAIKIECIDEIAKLAGSGEIVSAITASAMRGELDFEQSLRKRVGTLENAPESILQTVREKLPLMDGFEQMVSELKAYGWKLAIASGGFDYFADYLKEKYQLDYAVSNQLEIIDGELTGVVLGKVVDVQYKAETLTRLGEQFKIPQQQWVAIGDGANDLLMIKSAALGVALHAKPKVQEQAKFVINFGDLSALCVLLNAKNLYVSSN